MKKKTYSVMSKNFVSKKYEVMKLIYDPRTGKEGLAIYESKKEAEFCKSIALALCGGCMEIKIKN